MGASGHSSADQSLQQLAQLIAEGISGKNPECFFDLLSEKLAQATKADYTIVARTLNNCRSAETLSFYALGEHHNNFTYDLRDTPCYQLINGQYCFFPSNVSNLFEKDMHLQQMQAEAYLGTRLFDRSGATIGLIALIYCKPIEEQDYLLTLLQIFAVPAAMELSRRREQRSRELLERRLNSILSIAREAIIATDEHSNIIMFNEGAESIFGYKASEALGNSVNMLLPEQMRDKHRMLMREFMDSSEISRLMSQRNGDIVAKRKNGQVFPAEASITKTHSDEETTVIVVLRDITERQQSEHALQSATRMQTLGNLAAGLAHDFNNILTLIRGSLDLLAQNETAVGLDKKQLEVATKATDRGAELVSRLIAFGRPRNLHPEAIDPSKLIGQLMDMLRVTLGEHIQLSFENKSSNCKVFVDPSQLENAIVNLSFNARDAMQSGGRLAISIDSLQLDDSDLMEQLQLQQGKYVSIRIADTGSGMSKETRERALEPFYSTKTDTGGSGLGLSMVLGFVRSANGALRIDSEIGQGTCIEVYLPVFEEQGPTDEVDVTDDTAQLKGNETLLIVEDHPEIRQVAVLYATSLGYRVLEAEDGPQALAQLEEHPEIDLLFTDYQLPGGLSGLNLANRISTAHPQTKILISSGYDTQHIDLTKFYLLPKPYSLQTFAKYLRKILDSEG